MQIEWWSKRKGNVSEDALPFDIYGENRIDDERIVLNINPDE